VADKTFSFFDQNSSTPPPKPAPYLAIAISGHELLAPPLRLCLSNVTQVRIGRGDQRHHHRAGDVLHIELADGWMSSVHGHIVKTAHGWQLHDSGSKNGTFLKGKQLSAPCELQDGDVITVGNVALVFRESPAPVGDLELPMTALTASSTLNAPLQKAFDALGRICRTSVPILIAGETGTGKELIAQTIHRRSARSGPFVALNCGAIPDNLIESQLFGHKKGAFSGADDDHPGFVRAADHGTLFLDEVAELPAHLQVKLLRVLQEHTVIPLGAITPVHVDLRVIAATHQDISARISDGRFRQDLHHRLLGHTFELPPLRHRLEDLGLLIAALLQRIAGDDAAHVRLERNAIGALFGYSWPGNVRELEHTLRAAWLLARPEPIALDHLPNQFHQAPPAPADSDEHRKEQLRSLLRLHKGNVAQVARAMGIKHRVQVHRWCKRFGIDPAAFR